MSYLLPRLSNIPEYVSHRCWIWQKWSTVTLCCQGLEADYWIGLNDQAVANEYRWQATGDVTTWTHWYLGEPNDGNGNGEACVGVFPRWFAFMWADVRCTNDYNLLPLCEHSPWWWSDTWNNRNMQSYYRTLINDMLMIGHWLMTCLL